MKFDHIALQTINFEKTLSFYEKLWFKIIKKIVDDDFKKIYKLWLNNLCIEIFSENILLDNVIENISKIWFTHICLDINESEKKIIQDNFKILREQKYGNLEIFFIQWPNNEEIEFNFHSTED